MDFVITWVDDSDPEWKEQFYKHSKHTLNDKREERFRSWDNFHYWFRGVEKFAPWVDKVHFVTWGHTPSWMNVDHPKLNIVEHSDFIPEQYLPTFNTRTIELNLHRIEELSEEYVLFNDDVFLIDQVYEDMFFVNGKPCDMSVIMPFGISEYSKTILNDLLVVNKHFNIKESFKKKLSNWINIKYGKFNFSNLFFLLFFKSHSLVFRNFHLALPSRKETLSLLWELEYGVMHKSSNSTFRNYDTVNNYVQRYWDLTTNKFHPINIEKIGRSFKANSENIEELLKFIRCQKRPIVCVNDDVSFKDFEIIKNEINQVFENLLPEKSKFEL